MSQLSMCCWYLWKHPSQSQPASENGQTTTRFLISCSTDSSRKYCMIKRIAFVNSYGLPLSWPLVTARTCIMHGSQRQIMRELIEFISYKHTRTTTGSLGTRLTNWISESLACALYTVGQHALKLTGAPCLSFCKKVTLQSSRGHCAGVFWASISSAQDLQSRCSQRSLMGSFNSSSHLAQT